MTARAPWNGIVVVIPAYNERRTIADVLRGLRTHGYRQVVVVDDGSTDGTAELAAQEGVVVLRHLVNRGVGGALGTGIKAALRLGAEIVVTFDADGQHDPTDIPPLVEWIEAGRADVVIGTRLVDPRGMPWYRRLANWVASHVTFLLFGIMLTDSQSGLRAFSRAAAGRIRIITSGMEASSEIAGEIARNHLRWTEVPIKAIYTEYSLSKGQSFMMGLRTLRKLLLTKLRRSAR